jgi:hypothetical protein
VKDYTSFRQNLDSVLRTRDIKQVNNFLIAEGQWQAGQTADPEYAMWMMIAGSATLRDLHEQARQWLVTHGHEAEASMVLSGGQNKGQHKDRPGGQSRGQHNRPGKGQGKSPGRGNGRGQQQRRASHS